MNNGLWDADTPWTKVSSSRRKRHHPEQDRIPLNPIPAHADIWIHIFELAIQEREHACTKGPTIMNLSRVCRSWRAWARSSPLLWNQIWFPVTPSCIDVWTPGVLQTYLDLSGSAHLDVTLDGRFQHPNDLSTFHSHCVRDRSGHAGSDPYNHNWEVWGNHTSCHKWLDVLNSRFRQLGKRLGSHASRILSIKIRLQSLSEFTMSRWNHYWEIAIGDPMTRFHQLRTFELSCYQGTEMKTPRIDRILWPLSTDQLPSLGSFSMSGVQVAGSIADGAPLGHPKSLVRFLRTTFSGHRNLTQLSLYAGLRPNGTRRVQPQSLSLPALRFLRLGNLVDSVEPDPGPGDYWDDPPYLPDFLAGDVLHMLDAPRLEGLDIRGHRVITEMSDYLCKLAELSKFSSVSQIRLIGNSQNDFTRLAQAVSLAMPAIRHASFYGNVGSKLMAGMSPSNQQPANVPLHSAWTNLEAIAIHQTGINKNQTIHLQHFLKARIGSGSQLRRVFIKDVMQQPAISRWVDAQGFLFEDWEEDIDSWPWNASSDPSMRTILKESASMSK